jgi:hypothetical protein
MAKRALRAAVLLAALMPLPALAGEVCVIVRAIDLADDERKYEIWLERGPQTDFAFSWTCTIKTESSTSESSNASFSFRKPDQDDKLGSCSGGVEPGTQVKIAVDLSLATTPETPKKLGALTFTFDPTLPPDNKRQCKAF